MARVLHFGLLALVCTMLSSVATADDELCPAVEALATEARSGFADRVTDGGARLPGVEHCGSVRTLSGAEALYCAWTFPLRNPAASEHFAMLDRCFADSEPLGEDKPVNHPDTHRLRRYRLNGAEMTVSLKDKSAHGRTYVFLGAAPIGE